MVSVGNKDILCAADAAHTTAPGHDPETPPKERMSRIDDFDLSTVFFYWVVELGIKLLARLIASIIKRY
jgi:hypothetical protein